MHSTFVPAGVVWVLGGGSGIGAGVARSLAGGGRTVVVSGRREAELQAVAESVPDAPGRVLAVPADVSDGASLAAAHERIATEHGYVELLVYSAGTNVPNRFWSDTVPDDFARVLDVNLTGAVRALHCVLPGMRAAGRGLIVLVSSWAAWRFGAGAGAAYSASKTSLGVLTETLNVQERQHGIRATHLCPGEVRTDILNTRPVVPGEAEQQLMLTAEDLGDAVQYLAGLPPRICVNELVITPTSNTSYSTAHAATQPSRKRSPAS